MKHQSPRTGRPLATASLALALAAYACGDNPENTNVPPKPTDLDQSNVPAAVGAPKEAQWNALVSKLGIPSSNEAVSTLLTETSKAAEYKALLEKVAGVHAKAAPKTRCAGINSVTEVMSAKELNDQGQVIDFSAAKVYLMKYKLFTDAQGKIDDTERSGLVVVPTATPSAGQAYPLAAYGHGGDAGLSYGEIATVFDQLQATHIIVAPSFPGEVVCAGSVDPSTKSCVNAAEKLADANTAVGNSIYDTDADELLGMHHCVVRASIPSATQGGFATATAVKKIDGSDAGLIFNQDIAAKVSRHTSGNPQSLVLGASRGGQVANLALAKTGGALSVYANTALSTEQKSAILGNGYIPSQFSCAATVFAPSTLTAGYGKVIFEQVIRGNVANTNFKLIPSVPGLVNAFESYIALDSAESVEAAADAAAVAVAQRDALLSTPLIATALRKWSSYTGSNLGDPGAYALLHGTKDKVVNVSHSIFAAAVWSTFNASAESKAAASAPGFSLSAGFFNPVASFADAEGNLTGSYTQHGDAAFFASQIVPATAVNAALPASLTKDDYVSAKQTPAVNFASWRLTSCAL